MGGEKKGSRRRPFLPIRRSARRRHKVLETTEASSGRILPYFKLLESLRSFRIGSRAGAKSPPAPCVQAARAPSLRPRPGRHCPGLPWQTGTRGAAGGSPDVARRDGGGNGRGAGFGVGRGWRGAVGGPVGGLRPQFPRSKGARWLGVWRE